MASAPAARRLARAAGLFLVGYGLLGIVLTVALLVVGGASVEQAESVSSTVAASVSAASASLDEAGTAFGGFDASLAEAQSSAELAAELARDTSATMASLAAAMSIRILGTQPLLPIAADFERASGQLDALADTVDRIADNLEANRDDVTAVSTNLAELAAQVELLEATTGEAPPIRLLLYLFVAWLALPSLAAVAGGAWLLRRRPPASA